MINFRHIPVFARRVVASMAVACFAVATPASRAAAQPQASAPTAAKDAFRQPTADVAGKSPARADPALASKSAPQTKPAWAELTAAQQASLKPLAANWASLSEAHKRKWIALAQNYPKMSQTDQTRLHGRMTEWVTLSPQQRAQARFNFAETQKLSADEKAATWKAYQALSPEEKKQLASKGNTVPPGATLAVKPVPSQKLAPVPSTRKDPKPAQVAAHQQKVAPNTLLPQLPSSDAQPATPKY